jgi:glycosyltransferase involved in cell wall biosynthesis
MNIAILFDRFLSEYGADRVHLEQARGFRKKGCEVYLFGQKFSDKVLLEFAGKCIIGVSSGGLDHDADVATHVRGFYEGLRNRGVTIDVAIHGGWPYLSAIAASREFCRSVVFVDFGVVPELGYGADHVILLREVKRLRAQFLPRCDAIVSISEFIRSSQAIVDAPDALHRTILLGGDHYSLAIEHSNSLQDKAATTSSEQLFNEILGRFNHIVLQLGRYEPGTYKASEEIFHLAEFLHTFEAGTACLYLGDINNWQTPVHMRQYVFAIGRPEDRVLARIMQKCSLTTVPSLWEGFNLPLLEAQWCNKPCLVLDRCAHPEVVWDQRLLCDDFVGMRFKALDSLRSGGEAVFNIPDDIVARKKEFFSWGRMVDQYNDLFQELLS